MTASRTRRTGSSTSCPTCRLPADPARRLRRREGRRRLVRQAPGEGRTSTGRCTRAGAQVRRRGPARCPAAKRHRPRRLLAHLHLLPHRRHRRAGHPGRHRLHERRAGLPAQRHRRDPDLRRRRAARPVPSPAAVVKSWATPRPARSSAPSPPRWIMTIAFFMILEQLQIAPEIVRIAFTAIMFALALGLALAFGLGGRGCRRHAATGEGQGLRRCSPGQARRQGRQLIGPVTR